MMAVKMPCSGLTPEAMAKAMASGSATMPTVMPAPRSATKAAAVVADQRVAQPRPERRDLDAGRQLQAHGRGAQRTRMPGMAPAQGSST